MKLLKSWVLVYVLFAPTLVATSAENIPGKIIFSVEQVDFDTIPPRGKTGIFYYYQEFGLGRSVRLTGYRFKDGKVTDVAGSGGAESDRQVEKLRALPISTFDVASELEAARLKMLTQTNNRYIVADGARYRIFYDFNGVNIDYTGQTPSTHIDYLAPYSPSLRNLQELMDSFALLFGRRILSQ